MRETTVDRPTGLSVRLKLALSYAGLLMLAGVLMLAAVWMVILRYIPNGALSHAHPSWRFLVNRSDPLHGFGSIAAIRGRCAPRNSCLNACRKAMQPVDNSGCHWHVTMQR